MDHRVLYLGGGHPERSQGRHAVIWQQAAVRRVRRHTSTQHDHRLHAHHPAAPGQARHAHGDCL